jgi:SAM-dependent methyltransferase
MSFFRSLASWNFGNSSLAGLASRSLLDTARLALAPEGRSFGLAEGIASSVIAGSSEFAANALDYGRLLNGRDLEKRTLSSLTEALPQYPLPFATHPLLMNVVFGLRKRSRDAVLRQLSEGQHGIQPYLREPLETLLRRHGLDVDMDLLAPRDAANEAFFAAHPLPMFDGVNTRGIVQYDRELFGRDLLETLAGGVKPEQTRLWRILKNLPKGAVVADWGGGMGVFAYELKRLRPDVTVYVVDRHPPAEALENSLALANNPASPEARSVLSAIQPVIGDGETVTLPNGRRADAIFSVHLSPYVGDALGLAAHLYNQLKPGGLLITTISAHLFDASETWLQWHKIHQETARDLSGFGLETLSAQEGRTLAVRRRDDRRLVRSARLRGSFDHVDFIPHFGRRNSRLGLYEAAERPIGRWLALEKP